MIRLICVGLGGMGKYDWSAAAAVPAFKIVAGVEVNENAAKDFKATIGAPVFGTLTEALKAVPADAAVVATPDKFHAPLSIEALTAGLDVITEKPMAESLADARRMHETARKHDRLLMVHQQLRWSACMHHARRLIQEGAIGQVRCLEFDMAVFSGAPLGGYRSQLRQLMLQDLAIHHFDLIRYLSGRECVSVYAKSWRANEEAIRIPATTNVYALLEMTGDVTARYTSKMRALTGHTGYNCAAVVTGSRGELVVHQDELKLQTHALQVKGLPPTSIVPEAPPRSTWESFADAIATRQPTLTDSGDNLKSLAMLFAAITSVEENRVVHL